MSVDDPNELERVDLEIRANELREEARELAGGEMTTYESPDMPPGLAAAFWQSVVDYEKAPMTCNFDQLTRDGVPLPPPDEVTDERLHDTLWAVIRGLAKRRVFLSATDHLGDRELYEELWYDALREAVPDMEIGPDASCGIDLCGSGSEEDQDTYLRYYADDETRDWFQKDFPDMVMPPRQTPPYDRDRTLPQAEYRRPD